MSVVSKAPSLCTWTSHVNESVSPCTKSFMLLGSITNINALIVIGIFVFYGRILNQLVVARIKMLAAESTSKSSSGLRSRPRRMISSPLCTTMDMPSPPSPESSQQLLTRTRKHSVPSESRHQPMIFVNCVGSTRAPSAMNCPAQNYLNAVTVITPLMSVVFVMVLKTVSMARTRKNALHVMESVHGNVRTRNNASGQSNVAMGGQTVTTAPMSVIASILVVTSSVLVESYFLSFVSVSMAVQFTTVHRLTSTSRFRMQTRPGIWALSPVRILPMF